MENLLYYDLKNKYKNFYYHSYTIENLEDCINISFKFSIDGLTHFTPSLSIAKKNFKFFNGITSDTAKKIVF